MKILFLFSIVCFFNNDTIYAQNAQTTAPKDSESVPDTGSLFSKKVFYESDKIKLEGVKSRIDLFDQKFGGKSIASFTVSGTLPRPLPPCLPERCYDLILKYLNSDNYQLLIGTERIPVTLRRLSSNNDFEKQFASKGNRLSFKKVN